MNRAIFDNARAWLSGALRNRDGWAMVFLAAFPWLYFWRVTFGQGVWFTTDIMLLYHPFGVELARALAENRLPLWSPNLLAGFPLFAEGHVATFYPPYLALFKFFPAHFALSYAMLLHLSWMACGMYAYARALGLGRPSAALAGFVFSFNGMTLEKLYHTPILIASAWLPWQIFFQQRWMASRRRIWFLLLTTAVALQLVSGFPQTALLSALALGAFGLFETLVTSASRRWSNLLLATVLPLGLGAGLAAAQIVPTLELIQQSVRSATLDKDFLTEYSLPPAFLAQFIFPYAPGEPIEHTNEYWVFFGIAPFLLALLAPLLRRSPRVIFLAGFALCALALALGRFNPLYDLIYQLPGFNLFRTPARYLFLFLFGATLLGALAFDELTRRLTPTPINKLTLGIALILGLASGGVFWLTQFQPLEFWLSAWQWLPFAIGVIASSAFVLAWRRKLARHVWLVAILGLTGFELLSFAPPFRFTLAQLTAPAYIETTPRVVNALGEPRVTDRVLTDLSVVPSVPAVRASLAPNQATLYGRQSAQAYSPLTYARHTAYLGRLSAPMANLLNVRYFMLPLEPRYANRVAAPTQSLAWDVVGEPITISPTFVSAIEVTSFVERAMELPVGTPVARVTLEFEDARREAFPLRLGIETDDWEFERVQASAPAQRASAPVARSFPGATRAYGKLFEARTYRARYPLAPARALVALHIESALPAGRLCIESVTLERPNASPLSLATLVGRADLVAAYMSDTVGVWENRDVLPRALIVHAAEIADDDAALARLSRFDFPARRMAMLDQGQAMRAETASSTDAVEILEYAPERVILRATTAQPGYLILNDAWYPGWQAAVDGVPTPIARANMLFRAIRLEPGQHRVEFEYRPTSLIVGAAISIASAVGMFVIAWLFIKGRA